MNKNIETQIVDAEEKLRLAMLASDVDVLGELLASNLIFTNHLGQRLGKEDDLLAHQSGALRISALEPSEQQINSVSDSVAIVSVRVQVSGTYGGQPAGGSFRFTRIWVRSSVGEWQVAAAHAGLIS